VIPRRTLPGTDLRLSAIGFGTASLHHLRNLQDRLALLGTALDAGITHFDTAPVYGLGLAEDTLGTFLKGRRGQVTLTTKIGLYPAHGRVRSMSGLWLSKLRGKLPGAAPQFRLDLGLSAAKASLAASMRALQTDHIDMLLLHEPAVALTDDLVTWLDRQRDAGRIGYWGLAGEAEILRAHLRRAGPEGQVLQTRDSLLGSEAAFLADHGWPMQMTYGYFSAGSATIDAVLSRNATGCALISTRRPERLLSLVGNAP
jgi:aryl-alcohol dehydrogenase-like predicted oxidoreductase